MKELYVAPLFVAWSSLAIAQQPQTLQEKLTAVEMSVEYNKNGCTGVYQNSSASRLAQIVGGFALLRAFAEPNTTIITHFEDGNASMVSRYSNLAHEPLLMSDLRKKGVGSLTYSASCILAYHSKKDESTHGPLGGALQDHGFTFAIKETQNGKWYFGSKNLTN